MTDALADASTQSATAAMMGHIRELVECESPSSDLFAVARSADLIATIGRAVLGAEPERISVNGVSHLRWRFGSETKVLLLAHHDTVWPLGTLERSPFAVHQGVLTGPGCFDMKTGLVMALYAIAALSDRSGVTLLVTGDEETGSEHSRALIESTASGARAALVLEASADGGAVKIERKGVSIYDIVVHGRAAHAGLEPDRGVNATVALAYTVLALIALNDPVSGTTVTPTVATAGTTSNTVPAEARVRVDVRARTHIEQRRVDDALQALDVPVPGAEIEVRGGLNRPPLERSAALPLFAHALSTAASLGLPALEGVAVGGGSDGNFTAGIGVPTLDGLGAVGGGAHSEDERVIVGEIVPRTRLLAALVDQLLNEGEA